VNTPHSLDVSATRSVNNASSPPRLDAVSLAALVAVFIGWFFVDTLVARLGALEHGVRFFDISSVIADPMRIFFAADTSWQRFAFGLLCFAALLAPLIAMRRVSWAWMLHFAPLLLMLACGAVLYSKTSSEFFAAPSDAPTVAGNVIRFANNLVHQGSGLVSRHISIGPGGYLAFLGSVVLAVQGVRRHRRHET
jgi:hypothetical protein